MNRWPTPKAEPGSRCPDCGGYGDHVYTLGFDTRGLVIWSVKCEACHGSGRRQILGGGTDRGSSPRNG